MLPQAVIKQAEDRGTSEAQIGSRLQDNPYRDPAYTGDTASDVETLRQAWDRGWHAGALKYTVSYTSPEGEQIKESYIGIPERAYAALGQPWSEATGMLFVTRLAKGGTSLIPLTGPDGRQAQLKPEAEANKAAGKTVQEGQWRPE